MDLSRFGEGELELLVPGDDGVEEVAISSWLYLERLGEELRELKGSIFEEVAV
ncbi:MAG: hypothetical protein J0H12_06180 [Candidatus Paracaedimonas acanthamoebae]|uniref:Uncharacterized protein n=1 Tax=Candidatus Paracaedimonas acanthamoebae TaxID=244581 RepID=A0A8J7PJQ7_9PROT|nr:hypothetical protein [Candidatus Paracaedimonas acanthamoebae]